MITEFMGKPIDYWIELDNSAKLNNFETVIEDNARLRAELGLKNQILSDIKRLIGQFK